MAKVKEEYYKERIVQYEALQQRIVMTLSSMQLENGAFPDTPVADGIVRITPHDACYTVMAILRSGMDGSAESARRYFDWHFSKMNTAEKDICGLAGTVYDYEAEISNGELVSERSTKSYDTADASAAMLLTALATYAETTGDFDYLLLHTREILQALAVLDALTTEKMSIGRPDEPHYSLRGNAAVIQGYWSGAFMLEKLFVMETTNTVMQSRISIALEDARESWTTMEGMLKTKLYVNREGRYHTSVSITGKRLSYGDFSWETFYPDAALQLFPTISGVLDARSRVSKTLYRKFCANWDWQELDFLSEHTADYCGYLAYCASLRGDIARLDAYFEQLEQHGVLTDTAYPGHNSDTAWLALACNQHIAWMNNEIIRWDPLSTFSEWALGIGEDMDTWTGSELPEWVDIIFGPEGIGWFNLGS